MRLLKSVQDLQFVALTDSVLHPEILKQVQDDRTENVPKTVINVPTSLFTPKKHNAERDKRLSGSGHRLPVSPFPFYPPRSILRVTFHSSLFTLHSSLNSPFTLGAPATKSFR